MTLSSTAGKQVEDSGKESPIAQNHLLLIGLFLSVPIVVNLVAGVAHTIDGALNPGLYELAIAFLISWASVLVIISEAYIGIIEKI